jgi:hypothetical protein
VVSEGAGNSLDEALDTIGMAEMLALLGSAQGSGPAVAIAADGAMPRGLLSYLSRHGAVRITTIGLTLPRILPENAGCAAADPACQTEVSPDRALCTSWAENDIRIVVSRVKTDRRGAYSLCGAALKACLSHGDLSALLERYPAHCSIVADPMDDIPAVIADHPLLADWVGATLMGRDPYSAPANADWFRRGLLPRVYRIDGDTRPVQSWRNPPSLKRDLPQAVYGDPVVRYLVQGVADAAAAWVAYGKSVLEPFLPPRTSGQDDLSTRDVLVERIAAGVSSESLGELLEALLKALGLLIGFHPLLKDEIRTLRAGYRLTTRDRRMNVAARFSDGVLMASRADSGPVNVTLIFKDTPALLRLFASPKPDLLGAMLKQHVAFEGNLNYLLKLAYFLRRITLIVQGDLRRIA